MMSTTNQSRKGRPRATATTMVLAMLAACCSRTPSAANAGAHEIRPAELLHALMTQPDQWRVLDNRDQDAFDTFHLPGATRATSAKPSPRPGNAHNVVICGDRALARNACSRAREQGRRNVFALAASIDEVRTAWLERPAGVDPLSKGLQDRFAMQKAFLLGATSQQLKQRFATDPNELTTPTMVSTNWLQQHINEVAVLDVRSANWFAAYHVPGAIQTNVRDLRKKRGETYNLLLDERALAAHFGQLGLQWNQPVVIASDQRLLDATFVALALQRLGHQRIAILEGGMLAWASERRILASGMGATTGERTTKYEPVRPPQSFAITTEEVAAAVAAGEAQVLDCRPSDSFTGERSRDRRKGHIPGARNRPFAQDLATGDNGQWLRARDQLTAAYQQKLRDEQPIVVSCRTGHAASQTYFVLRHLLGYQHVRWHNGSWLEWSDNDALPIETGAERTR